MSTFTAKKIYSGKPTEATSTLYTVATGASIIIKNITLINTTSTSANITMYLVDTGDSPSSGNLYFNTQSVTSGDTIILNDLIEVLEASGTIAAFQSATGVIAMRISGVTIT